MLTSSCTAMLRLESKRAGASCMSLKRRKIPNEREDVKEIRVSAERETFRTIGLYAKHVECIKQNEPDCMGLRLTTIMQQAQHGIQVCKALGSSEVFMMESILMAVQRAHRVHLHSCHT